MRPENALLSLGRRFDALETQLNSVLGHVATRADLDELRAAEAQIEEIGNQLSQFRRQLARLDVIDAHLGTLTSQLSDERLTRLFNEGVQVTADAGRLDAIDAQLRMIAVQLSDERLSGLVSRSSARATTTRISPTRPRSAPPPTSPTATSTVPSRATSAKCAACSRA